MLSRFNIEKYFIRAVSIVIFGIAIFLLIPKVLFLPLILIAISICLFFYDSIIEIIKNIPCISASDIGKINISNTNIYFEKQGEYRPINSCDESDNRLNRVEYAEHIANMIISKPILPMVYGINGIWGVGKTSLMNMVFDCLGKKYPCQYISLSFNSWHYRTPQKITQQFLLEIQQKIIPHINNASDFKKRMRNITRHFSSISFWGLSLNMASIFSNEEKNIEEMAKILKEEFSSQLIVFIDDLDRIERNELQAVLRTIRLLSSLPKIKFILAYDRALLSRNLFGKDISRATDYLAKIIQHEFNLSIPNDNVKREILLDEIKDTFLNIAQPFENTFTEEEQYHIFRLLPTTREIKRVIAAACSLMDYKKNSYFPKDLFILVIFQYRLPLLYKWLNHNEEEIKCRLTCLHGLPLMNRDVSWSIEKNKEKGGEWIINQSLAHVPKEDRETTKVLMNSLIIESNYVYSTTLTEKKFKNPSVYSSYFDYTFNSLEQINLERILEQANKIISITIKESVGTQIQDTINKYNNILIEPIFWKIFLNLIIKNVGQEILCLAIAKVSDKLDGGQSYKDGFSIRSSFSYRVYDILYNYQQIDSNNNLSNKEVIINILIACITEATSYGLAAYLAKVSITPEYFQLQKKISFDDEDIKKVSAAIENKFNVYKQNTPLLNDEDFYDFVAVIAWTNLDEDSKTKIYAEIREKPQKLIKILAIYIGAAHENESALFNKLPELDKILNCEQLYQCVLNTDIEKNLTELNEINMYKLFKNYALSDK
jgi:hypothetical protein